MKRSGLILALSAIFILASISPLFSQARAKKKAMRDMDAFRYEIECVGTGVEGTYLIKVWTYSKKPKVAIEQSKKNAVHGVIFKGFAGGGRGCTSQKPLASSPEVEDQFSDFFDKFFADGGDYMKYVSLSNDGSIDSEDRLKVGKEYKIGVVVSVMKDQLRKDLEKAGIIKSLDSGF
jgi:hypothetical protein